MKICENCRGIINKPLCIGCLEKEIEFWLRNRKPELIPKIRDLLLNMINFNEKGRKCIICKNKTTVCSSCYLEDVYKILKKKDLELGKQFRFLFFDLEKKIMLQN